MDGGLPPSFIPFKVTKVYNTASPFFHTWPPHYFLQDFNSKHASDKTQFTPRIIPPTIQPQIPNPPLLLTKFLVSLTIAQCVTTARQPLAPRIPIKPLPPPGATVNRLWGAFEAHLNTCLIRSMPLIIYLSQNVQLTSFVTLPQFSHHLEAGAQPYRLAMGGTTIHSKSHFIFCF